MNKNISDLLPVFWKSALLFLLVYLYMGLRLAPFGDEAWDWFMVDKSVYIAAGRPGLAAYLTLAAGHGVPYAYCIATAAFFALAVCLQISLLKVESQVARFSFAALQVAVVQYSYTMIDSFLADAVMLGVAISSLSFWLVSRGNTQWFHVLGAVLCAAAAASVYQLILLVIPVLYLAYALRTMGERNVREHLRLGFKTAGVCIAAVALYHGVRVACMGLAAEGVAESVAQYQNSLVTWGQLDIVTHVLHIGKQWCMHLVGAAYPGECLYATTLIPVLLYSAIIVRDAGRAGLEKLFYLALPVAIYVLPFLPIAALGEDQGARLFLAEPLACASLWTLLIMKKGWLLKPAQSVAACVLVSLFVLKACYTVSDIAFYQYRIFRENQTEYWELKNRIAQVENKAGFATGTVPVVFSGHWQSELRKADKYNSCIINPSDVFFYSFIGDRQVKGTASSSTPGKELNEKLNTMPTWPDPGSTVYHNGEIIVKF